MSFVSFIGKKMYKSIQMTDKELDLLASIIGYYIDQKKTTQGFEINNAHILLRHILSKKPNGEVNQLAFYGKWEKNQQ